MDVRIEESWKKVLSQEWDAPYFEALTRWVKQEYKAHPGQVYPPAGRIFAAFDLCPIDNLKVVILGQDPYHGPGQANGLAFSVGDGIALPPSLVNIFKEIEADTGTPRRTNGDLSDWARQGVLLLNTTLTVEAHKPTSHSGHGWEYLTDAAIRAASTATSGTVFMLWGAHAIRKRELIDSSRHLILTSPHPSPLSASRGFFGCRHFSQANAYLEAHGKTPILW